MRLIVFALALVVGAPSSGTAAPDKVQYELQERCGKRASEYFEKQYGDGSSDTADGHMMSNYQNHYNKAVNKCFMAITTTTINAPKKIISTSIELFDLNENKPYGSFYQTNVGVAPFLCKVLAAICQSMIEWDVLLQRYMDDAE